MKRKILILGSSGMVGSSLVRIIKKKKYIKYFVQKEKKLILVNIIKYISISRIAGQM
jgi:dTDP-4-dehydrorhamnose reductase